MKSPGRKKPKPRPSRRQSDSDDEEDNLLPNSGSFNSFASTQMFASRLAELEEDDDDACNMCFGGKLRCCVATPKRRFGIGGTLLVFGLVFLIGGPFLSTVVRQQVATQIRQQIVIDSPNAEGYKAWVRNDQPDAVPLWLRIYMWNLTNHEDVRMGAKPIYKEIGPYCYRKYRVRFNLTFFEEGNKVKYWRQRYFHFDAKESKRLSGMDLDPRGDTIVNINPSYLAALSQTGNEVELTVALVGPLMGQHVQLFRDALIPQIQNRVSPTVLGEYVNNLTALIQNSYPNVQDPMAFFLNQWANVSNPIPVSSLWQFMHITQNGQLSSGIPLTIAQSLFSGATQGSLMDPGYQSCQMWADAYTQPQVLNQLASQFSLSVNQTQMIVNWLHEFQINSATTYLLKKHNARTLDDLAMLQWSQGNVSIPAFADVGTLFPQRHLLHKMSYAVWARSVIIPVDRYSVNLEQTQLLLSGPDAITNPNNLGDFVQAKLSKNHAYIEQRWHLNVNQSTFVSGYITYMTGTFAKSYLLDEAFPQGLGVFGWRSTHEWIWGWNNPLLGMLAPGSQFVSYQFNDTDQESVKSHAAMDTHWTGKNDILKIQQFLTWHNFTGAVTGVWAQPEPLGGTDGNQFPMFLNASDTVHVWENDLIRNLILQPMGDVTVKGINLRRYEIDNVTFVPTARYYTHFKGLANMTKPNQGAPMFYGKPHMLDCDSSWLDLIDGMTPPNRTLHDTWLDIEPLTGSTMNVHKRFAINTYLAKSDTMLDFYNGNIAKGLMYPVFWLDETATVPNDLATKFKGSVYLAITIEKISFYGGINIGAIGVFSGFLILFWKILCGAGDDTDDDWN